MKKPMTIEFVQRKSNSFFNEKKAVLLVTYSNGHGDFINENTEVIIISKNSRTKTWLDIKDPVTGIQFHGVLPFHLKLL